MAILVSIAINEARGILIDAAKVTWSDADLITYLNEALRTTSTVKHDFYTVRDQISLEAGVSQVLPEDAVALLDIIDNVASGKSITQVDLSMLHESNRFWPADTQETDVDNFAANTKEPTRYYVTPPNDGYGSVNAVYGAIPPLVSALGDTLPVSEQHQAALVNFVLSRAYAKNSKKQDTTKSDYYVKEWGKLIGLKAQTQIATAPKVTDSPESR